MNKISPALMVLAAACFGSALTLSIQGRFAVSLIVSGAGWVLLGLGMVTR